MAVDAYNLPFFPQQLLPQREVIQMGFVSPAGAGAGAADLLPFYSQAESGVTFNNAPTPSASMASVPTKRARVDAGLSAPAAAMSFLGEDMSVHLQQQLLDVDRLVLIHMERLRAELADRRRRFVAAVQAMTAKRLRAKDDELERLAKQNAQLDERVKALSMETQIWRDIAQYNEATASALRADLERALAAQAIVADDADSCCGAGENPAEEPQEAPPAASSRACRGCGEAEASVLLLPCRHLSACAACAAALAACPACGAGKNGSVNVNLDD